MKLILKQLFTFTILVVSALSVQAQTAINSDGSAPDASAMLDVKSTEKGLLIPRMSSTQRLAIDSLANGLLVYDTGTSSFWYYKGTTWTELVSGRTGGSSLFIGENAGINDDLTDNENIGIGTNALNLNTTGNNNTAIGINALNLNTTASFNSALGSYALENNTTGEYNTALGYTSLRSNTVGQDNTSVGNSALTANTTGNYNTATGRSALRANTTGNSNTATGYDALQNNTTATGNSAHGAEALRYNTIGTSNTASGYHSLQNNTSGNFNTGIGASALNKNTTGKYNSANGYVSLQNNTTGRYNSANGALSLLNNTTGDRNIAIGFQALKHNVSGSDNSAFGKSALVLNTIGSNNVALGNNSGYNSTGDNNIFLGFNSGYNELGSDKLYIENSDSATPLVYGDFATDLLRVNGQLQINDAAAGGYSLPTNDGTVGQVLETDGAGSLTWTDGTSGSTWANITDVDGDTQIQVEETANEDAIRFDIGGTEKWVMKGSRLEPKNTGKSVFIGINAGLTDNLNDNANVGIGSNTLHFNQWGKYNTAIGQNSLYKNTGAGNSATGYATLKENTSGIYNVANGYTALRDNTTGDNNTAIGANAMRYNISGEGNLAAGISALAKNTTGSNNVALGRGAGNNAVGNNNIFLGYSSGANELGSDKLYIENSDSATPLVYGDFATDLLRVNGQLQINDADSTGYSLPTADGIAGQVLETDGAGALNWTDGATASSWLESSGNINFATGLVGIGTDTPLGNLHLSTGSTGGSVAANYDNLVIEHINENIGMTFLSRNNANGGIAFADGDSEIQGALLYAHNDDHLSLYTNSVEAMRIKSNGNVGLGTIDPFYKLTVNTEDENHLRFENSSEYAFMTLKDSGNLDFFVHGYDDITFTNGSGGGIETMRINAAGHVGIGTDTPLGNLHIKASATGGTIAENYDNFILEQNSGNLGMTLLSRNNANGGIAFADGDSELQGAIIYQHYNDYDHMIFITNAQEAMRIKSDGKVGIGATNPAEKLHVAGNARVDGQLQINDATAGGFSLPIADGTAGQVLETDGAGALNWVAGATPSSWTENTEGISLATGNVGIGTTSPAHKLDVRGNLSVGTGTEDSKLLGVPSTGGNFNIGQTSSTGKINFVSSTDTDLMTIKNDGIVGIGTTTPGEHSAASSNLKLQVNGDLAVNAGFRLSIDHRWQVHGYLQYDDEILGARFKHFGHYGHRFDDNGGTRMVILQGGKVGIGTTTPSEKLHVAGNTRVDGQLQINDATAGGYSLPTTDGTAGQVLKTDGVGALNWTDGVTSSPWVENSGNLNFSTGFVGIGTDNPLSNLDIVNNTGAKMILGTGSNQVSSMNEIQFRHRYGGGGFADGQVLSSIKSQRDGSSGRGDLIFSTSSDNLTDASEKMVVKYDGKVGIGTTSPQEALHVNGSIRGNQGGALRVQSAHGYMDIGAKNDFWAHITTDMPRIYLEKTTGIGSGILGSHNTTDLKLTTGMLGTTDGITRLTILNENGYVGIGTSNPDELLTVNGIIHAKRVKVDLNTEGPDYVFEEDYNLMSLENTTQFIKENKHLPEVPSAKQMEKDGVDVAEFNMLLLKKIEEMTLYMIQMNKELKELKARNIEIEKKLSK